MKFLSAVLVLLVASNQVIGQDSSSTATTPGSDTSTGTPGSTVTSGTSDSTVSAGSTASAGTGSTVSAGTGPTAAPGSTVTDGSNTGSTVPAATTTPTPLKLSTFPVSNDVKVLDAKLILQQAVQLNQQINALNDYLKKAQADTDPNNSPLFAQLTAFSANITAQNTTLQGYVTKLQTLSDAQTSLDTRVNAATNTFVCFSQSSCVTDIPTTPLPTSPGSTPAVATCSNKTVTATYTSQSYPAVSVQNAAECSIAVKPSDSSNNVTVTINATFTGSDVAYVRLVETRTQQSVTINGTISNYNFTGFQEVDVFYYSGPRSTVQFSFDYVEVNNCVLDCHFPNGTCKVSQSGVQYCECKQCEFSGNNCETPIADPCQSKQQRACGATGGSPYGTCYRNPCMDQCYACMCVDGARDPDSPLKCNKPSGTYPPGPIPTPDPDSIVCPTTAAPTTTPALLTSTLVSSGTTHSTGTVNPSQPTGGSTVSSASPGTTPTVDPNASTGSTVTTGSEATSPSTVVISTGASVGSTATSNLTPV